MSSRTRTRRTAIVGMCFLAASACSQPSPDTASTGAGSGQQQSVRWPEPERVSQAALQTLPPAVAAEVQKSPVPVLAPAEPALLASATTTVGTNHFTLASSTAGITVSVHASPAVAGTLETPVAVLPRTRVGDRDVFLTQNEGIRVATWTENGVAYAMDVECATAADPRCQDDKYLLGLVGNAVYLGGAQARR